MFCLLRYLSSDIYDDPTRFIHNWACAWQNQQNDMRPAKKISLGICPVRSESSLSARRNLGSLATHWVHSVDSDQLGRSES